ncbi:MAG: CheB methylesterase [Solirubrobacterales bacterium]|nr:CheB methylesterase [Solirubrobacterales bacterium]
MATAETHHAPGAPSIVVMGASAGGVDALSDVVRGLPADFPAAVLVVLHISASSPSMLPQILDRASPLTAVAADDGAPLEAGCIYVARPDLHLKVEDGVARLTAEARVNGHRPAVDSLFCSAADARGPAVTGVVLSGMRDDGTVGLARIKECGGIAVVQDPEDAQHDSMPLSAIENVAVDAILPAREIGPALARFLSDSTLPAHGNGVPPPAESEVDNPLITVCPDCGGVLSERREHGLTVFTCHVGHAYSPHSLIDLQRSAVESALWTAVRALEDRQALLARLAEQSESRGQPHSARSFARQAQASTDQADRVREAIAALAGEAEAVS